MDGIIQIKDYKTLALEKLDTEFKEFNCNDKYAGAVKQFVLSTIKNFCSQDDRFAKTVYLTRPTLSNCCEAIMHELTKQSKTHVSDIDVYRAAVQFYFPNSDIRFTMTLDISGEEPDEAELNREYISASEKDRAKREADTKKAAEERAKKAKEEKIKAIRDAEEGSFFEGEEIPEESLEPIVKPKKPAASKKSNPVTPALEDNIIQLDLFGF